MPETTSLRSVEQLEARYAESKAAFAELLRHTAQKTKDIVGSHTGGNIVINGLERQLASCDDPEQRERILNGLLTLTSSLTKELTKQN